MRKLMISSVLKTLSVVTALGISVASYADSCDTAAGQKMFKRCAACHSLNEGEHKMGPSLYGLLDREVGSAEGFIYSVAMEQADFNWDKESLDKFLASPMGFMPGTSMPFAGLKKEKDRADLTCYLAEK